MKSAAISPLHPEVRVRLVGEDGNAFAILGRCQRAAKEAGVPKVVIGRFFAEATAGNYDDLLATAMRWFDVR